MKGRRYVKAGEGVCPACKRAFAVNLSGRLRKHWTAGLGSPLCAGSDELAAEAGTFEPPPPPAVLRGCLPLPGGREFAYVVPSPLSREDVSRISAVLLLHVEGEAELAWARAQQAGFVPDIGKAVTAGEPALHRHAWQPTGAPVRYRCECGAAAWRRDGEFVSAFADVGTGAG